jgi:hypothetical protein
MDIATQFSLSSIAAQTWSWEKLNSKHIQAVLQQVLELLDNTTIGRADNDADNLFLPGAFAVIMNNSDLF